MPICPRRRITLHELIQGSSTQGRHEKAALNIDSNPHHGSEKPNLTQTRPSKGNSIVLHQGHEYPRLSNIASRATALSRRIRGRKERERRKEKKEPIEEIVVVNLKNAYMAGEPLFVHKYRILHLKRSASRYSFHRQHTYGPLHLKRLSRASKDSSSIVLRVPKLKSPYIGKTFKGKSKSLQPQNYVNFDSSRLGELSSRIL
ncbi:hypothetical protein CR513_43460, partial [Mucuna pruriens]